MTFAWRVAGQYDGDLRRKMLPFSVTLAVENARVNFVQAGLYTANVIVRFSTPGVTTQTSAITITVQKKTHKPYKIIALETRDFEKDYNKFDLIVSGKNIPEKYLYKPITLAAFKTAKKLNTRYDGVLWFDHVGNKTFYYVYKGTVPADVYQSNGRDWASHNFSIGLVNPDLHEIIPVSYDLIHNIGGTIGGLIEVEKNNKKGLYNLDGKLIAPAEYDAIYPVSSNANIGLLKKGDNFYYLKKDLSITGALSNFSITQHMAEIKIYGKTTTLNNADPTEVMEANSRQMDNAIYIPPSYLVDWNMTPKIVIQVTPLRKMTGRPPANLMGPTVIKFDEGKKKPEPSWYERIFYTVKEHYLGGRSGFYESKSVIVADKRSNRILSFIAPALAGEPWLGRGPTLSGRCNENNMRALNDSVFEFKTTSTFYTMLAAHGHYLAEGPYYHYMQVKNGNLVPMPGRRQFPTQFVKLDDTYLQGCYLLMDSEYADPKNGIIIDTADAEMLEYMKNEIYASYHYQFKDEQWNALFASRFDNGDISTVKHENIQGSLTAIDKYNIDFINGKLRMLESKKLAAK